MPTNVAAKAENDHKILNTAPLRKLAETYGVSLSNDYFKKLAKKVETIVHDDARIRRNRFNHGQEESTEL